MNNDEQITDEKLFSIVTSSEACGCGDKLEWLG